VPAVVLGPRPRAFAWAHNTLSPAGPWRPGGASREILSRPRWDAPARILWLDDVIVKQFRVPAENQELVLAAFEEEKWLPHLDDPLPPRDNLDPKRRLHDTINRLNRNQCHKALHFEGDGTGRGIRWRLIATTLPLDRHQIASRRRADV